MSEESLFRWPYDELEIEPDPQPNTFNFKTPWAQVRVEFEPRYTNSVSEIADIIRSGPDITKVQEVSWLMGQLVRFPFYYILPRHPVKEKISCCTTHASPSQFLSTLGVVLDCQLNSEWEWGTEGVLTFTQSTEKGYFDPLSVLTLCRRFHFLNVGERDVSRELYRNLDRLKASSKQFSFACALIIRQNHYITEICTDVLRPALKISKRAKQNVADFIASEKGHDIILKRALNAMGYDPSQLPVLNHVKALMQVFKIAAGKNFLAFSIITDMFEAKSFETNCFFSDYLSENGYAKAASYLSKHKNINHNEGHEQVSFEFLKVQDPVSQQDALEALYFAESMSLLVSELSSKILKYLQCKQENSLAVDLS